MELVRNTKITFDEATHTYTNDKGVVLTGVTSVMKKMGVAPDFGDIPQATLDAAAKKGTLVHQAIEDWCEMVRKGEIDENRFAYEQDYVIEALEGFKGLGVKAIANEYLVSDNEYIATFIDVVEETGEPNLVDLGDLKYTSAVHKTALSWQLSLCKYLFELQNPEIKVRNLYCFHLKNGIKRVPIQEVSPEELNMFLNCFLNDLPYTPESIVLNEDQQHALLLIAQLEGFIMDLDERVKTLKKQRDELTGGIIALMKSHNVTKWQPTENLSFTYVAPQEREGLDSTRLKKEKPEIYNEYKKTTQVKESLRITIK